MARVTFINSILSGKLAGMVFANNKAGEYVRQYRKGTDPATTAQLANRASFAAASTAWHGLTDLQKGAWNAFATTIFKPKVGNAGVLFSGFNAFVSLMNVAINMNAKSNNPTITIPAAVTNTFLTFITAQDAPTQPLSSSITNAARSIPIQLMLTDVQFSGASGDCDFTLDFIAPGGPGALAAAPLFEDFIGGVPVGIALVASLPITQNQQFVNNPDINLIAVVPPSGALTGWSSSAVITYTNNAVGGYNDRKYNYQTGDIIQVKAYLIGQNGMTQPLNGLKVEVV